MVCALVAAMREHADRLGTFTRRCRGKSRIHLAPARKLTPRQRLGAVGGACQFRAVRRATRALRRALNRRVAAPQSGGRARQGKRLRTVTQGLPGVSRPWTEK